MRCGCVLCDSYMVQAERGLKSGCVCPSCGFTCASCNSADETPRSVEALKQLRLSFDSLPEDDADEGYGNAAFDDSKPAHWLSRL